MKRTGHERASEGDLPGDGSTAGSDGRANGTGEHCDGGDESLDGRLLRRGRRGEQGRMQKPLFAGC